jgi:dienelactone hydrolase
VAGDPDEAASLMNTVLGDMESGTKALQAGYQAFVDQPQVDAERTAAIGYCFGGAMVLHMARLGLPLSAVVSFHGALGSFHTATPGSIRPRVLVCHGEEDSMVTMDDLAGFKQEMETAQADYQVIVYPNAKHGFTNEAADGNGQKYANLRIAQHRNRAAYPARGQGIWYSCGTGTVIWIFTSIFVRQGRRLLFF